MTLLALVLAGCGSSDQTVTGAGAPASTAPTTSAGDELVALEDDLGLQTVDNIVGVIRSEKLTPAARQAIEKVTAALTTDELVGFNRMVDLERKTPAAVAKDYLESESLTTSVAAAVRSSSALRASTRTRSWPTCSRALWTPRASTPRSRTSNREVYEPALESGQLDVFPEYVGTLTEFLKKEGWWSGRPGQGQWRPRGHDDGPARPRRAARPDRARALRSRRPECLRRDQGLR